MLTNLCVGVVCCRLWSVIWTIGFCWVYIAEKVELQHAVCAIHNHTYTVMKNRLAKLFSSSMHTSMQVKKYYLWQMITGHPKKIPDYDRVQKQFTFLHSITSPYMGTRQRCELHPNSSYDQFVSASRRWFLCRFKAKKINVTCTTDSLIAWKNFVAIERRSSCSISKMKSLCCHETFSLVKKIKFLGLAMSHATTYKPVASLSTIGGLSSVGRLRQRWRGRLSRGRVTPRIWGIIRCTCGVNSWYRTAPHPGRERFIWRRPVDFMVFGASFRFFFLYFPLWRC